MSQSYNKTCSYCKQEIRMSERLGKWYPSDLDGGAHYCESKDKKQKQLSKPLTLEDLDLRLRMVEPIVTKGVNKK